MLKMGKLSPREDCIVSKQPDGDREVCARYQSSQTAIVEKSLGPVGLALSSLDLGARKICQDVGYASGDVFCAINVQKFVWPVCVGLWA